MKTKVNKVQTKIIKYFSYSIRPFPGRMVPPWHPSLLCHPPSCPSLAPRHWRIWCTPASTPRTVQHWWKNRSATALSCPEIFTSDKIAIKNITLNLAITDWTVGWWIKHRAEVIIFQFIAYIHTKLIKINGMIMSTHIDNDHVNDNGGNECYK